MHGKQAVGGSAQSLRDASKRRMLNVLPDDEPGVATPPLPPYTPSNVSPTFYPGQSECAPMCK